MALKANIVIDQGSDFSTTIDVTDDNGSPIDLSTYTGAAQMRKHYTSSNSTSFAVAVSNGVVTLSMSAAISNEVVPGRYVYDLELTDTSSNTVSRLVEGLVTVTPQVTR